MKKRSDNRGFTLVEIVIAVAILAIAISPLVANFIQSSKLNLKGRKSLNAMNLAQDMMEGMSGFTAEEVAGVIDGVIADSSKTLVGSILPSASECSSVSKTSPVGDAKLVYSLNGVKPVSGSASAYNVKLTLDPTGADQAAFNGKDMASITEINQYYDAIFNADSTEIGEAITKLHGKSNFSKMEDDYRGKVLRTIHIKVSEVVPAKTPAEYKVSVSRTYSLTPVFAAEVGLTGISHTITTDNIIKGDVKQIPRSVYLYFEGIQNSSQTARLDTIKVESVLGEEITVYLVQQAGASYNPDYGCDVKIISTDMAGTYTEDVHIVSNIRYKLDADIMASNFRDKREDGSDIPESEIEYPLTAEGRTKKLSELQESHYIKSSTYNKARAQYYYNSDVTLINDALYDSNFTAGYARKEKNTLYKVLIEVFDVASGERIAHYNGGLSN